MGNILQESAEYNSTGTQWLPITARKAEKLFIFERTVPFKSVIFRCQNCKQYLTFCISEKGLKIPYFRHRPGGPDCSLKLTMESEVDPEHETYSYKRKERSFEFPVFLVFRSPEKLRIIIETHLDHLEAREPCPNGIYLEKSLGLPHYRYILQYDRRSLSDNSSVSDGGLSEGHEPKFIDVIRSRGALFTTCTGQKIKYGRSPLIGEVYLFLVPSSCADRTFYENFSFKKEDLVEKWQDWSLYKIRLVGSAAQAKFIIDMGYDFPSAFRELEPIWPPAVSDSSDDSIDYIYLQKRPSYLAELNEENNQFLRIDSNTNYEPPEGFSIRTNPQLFQKGEKRYISDRDVLLQKDHSTSNGIEVVFTPHFDGFLRAYDLKNDCTLIPAFERKFCGNDKKQKFVLVNIPSTFLLKIFYSLDCVYCQAFLVSGDELKKFYVPKHISFPGKSEIKISSVSLKADKKREDKVSDQNEKKKEDKVKIKNGSTNVVLSAGHINSSDLLQSSGRLTFNSGTVFLNYIVNCNGKSFMLPIAFMKDAQLEPIYKDIRATKFNEIYPYMLELNAVEHSKKFEMCIVECDSNSTFLYPFDETTRTHIKIERRPHLLTGFLKKQPYANIKEYEKRFKKLNREEQKKIFDEGAIFYAYFCNETEPNALFYKQNKSGLYYTQRFILHSKNIVEIIINGMPHLFYSPEKIFSGIKSRSKNYRFTNSKKSSPKRVKQ